MSLLSSRRPCLPHRPKAKLHSLQAKGISRNYSAVFVTKADDASRTTLTQRHRHLIGTGIGRVESVWPKCQHRVLGVAPVAVLKGEAGATGATGLRRLISGRPL